MDKDEYIEKYGEEEGLKKYRQYARTLENFIYKYGEEDGTQRYENWKRNIKIGLANIPLEKKKEQTKRRSESKKGKTYKNLKRDINFYIEKYGEELGTQKYYAIIEKLKIAGKNISNISQKMKYRNSIQFYIDKYGEEEGIQRYENWCKSQDHGSLNFFIKKYGEEEGTRKYYEVNSRKYMRSYYSKISKECFDEICIFINDKEKALYADNEFCLSYIKDNIKHCFAYDFVYKRKIIEFQGDVWHCNPKIYKANDKNPRNILAENVWKYDAIKKEYAKQKGYEIMYIWESEWKTNKINILNNVLIFLNIK